MDKPLKANVISDLATLAAVLADGHWRTAAQIKLRLPAWHDRRIRQAAELSDGAVISAPGCEKGYRLAAASSRDEYVEEIRRRYVSQIRRMQERLAAMDAKFFPKTQQKELEL